MSDVIKVPTWRDNIGWFLRLEHKHCGNRENCTGPGCVRRTGKTARKRGRVFRHATGHAR
jgi:hypothetical protein